MSRTTANAEQVERTLGSSSGPIVVGYDGSEPAEAAIEYAADQAVARNRDLQVVSAYPVVVSDMAMASGVSVDAEMVDSVRTAAEQEAEHCVQRLSREHPGLTVTSLVAPGPAAAILINQSASASMVVVGSHGRGGVMGMLGGTSRQVATHSKAPTVVVRNARPAGDSVVVGLDGSPDSVGALSFAFDVASRERRSLLAVHTWDVPPIGALTGVPSPEPPELVKAMSENETRAAMEELAGFGERYPDVPVLHKIVRGSAVKVLVAESHGAALLVVGSRGRGGFLGLLLGSVSHGVLHHATCNIAVVAAKR